MVIIKVFHTENLVKPDKLNTNLFPIESPRNIVIHYKYLLLYNVTIHAYNACSRLDCLLRI